MIFFFFFFLRSLSTIGFSRCRRLLVFPQTNRFTCTVCHWKIAKISFGFSSQGIIANYNAQSSPIDSDVFVCKVSKLHVRRLRTEVGNLISFNCFGRLKKWNDSGSDCAKCAECGLSSCICCFWFLEKFLRYLNHNAYTVIGE